MVVASGQPTSTERARTVLDATPTVHIAACGTHDTVLDHGSDHLGRPLLILGPGSPLATLVDGSPEPIPARLDAARLHRLPLPDRVRDRISLHGRLALVSRAQHFAAIARLVRQRRLPPGDPLPAGAAVLRLEPAGITLDGFTVDLDGYRDAAPDPLLAAEDELLDDLTARPYDLAGLCTLLEPAILAEADRIAAAGLDRHGLTVHVVAPGRVRLARVDFPAPVADRAQAGAALDRLVEHARSRFGSAPR